MRYNPIARARFCERMDINCLTVDKWEEYIEGWRWRENREYPPDDISNVQGMGYVDAMADLG